MAVARLTMDIHVYMPVNFNLAVVTADCKTAKFYSLPIILATIDRKYFMLKIFRVQKLIFMGGASHEIKYGSYFVRNFAHEYRGHIYHGYTCIEY